MLFSVETLSFFGQSFTVFSLVGLILLFGIGVDYTIFFASMKEDIGKIFPGVLLAFATTEIAFLLLAFSSSRIASGFGIIMSSGLLMIFLLSPGRSSSNPGMTLIFTADRSTPPAARAGGL